MTAGSASSQLAAQHRQQQGQATYGVRHGGSIALGVLAQAMMKRSDEGRGGADEL